MPNSSVEVRTKLACDIVSVSPSGSLATFLELVSSWTRPPTSLSRFGGKLAAALRADSASMTCRPLAIRASSGFLSSLVVSTKHWLLPRGVEHAPGLTSCKSVRGRGARGDEAGHVWRMLARGLSRKSREL